MILRKFFVFLFLSAPVIIYGQQANSTSSELTPVNRGFQIADLKYHEEIPDENTYEVLKNNTSESVPNEILAKINMHRKFDRNFVWEVNEDIDILIYKKDLSSHQNQKK